MQTIFFWLSKLGWIFISPLNLIFIFLVIVWLLLLSNRLRLAKSLLSVIVIFLILLTLFPIGNLLMAPLEKRFKTNPELPKSVEGIIVLAGSIDPILSDYWKQVETGGAIERDLAFLRLANSYPDATLVYTGGSASLLHQEYKSADLAKVFYESQGFDTSRIVFERDARNTYENAILSMNKVRPKMKKPWILITSAFHMPRSVGIFCKLGWHVLPYPVDHYSRPDANFRVEFSLGDHISILDMAIHEWLGLFVYYVTGKSSSLYPSQCK